MNLKMTLETELKDLETSSLCLNGLFVWRNEGDNIYLSDRPGLLDDAVVEEFEFCHTDPSGANGDLIAWVDYKQDSKEGRPIYVREQ